jgi:hypothetical protein
MSEEQQGTEQQQPEMSDRLRMLQELMGEMSPQELAQAEQIKRQRDAEIAQATEDERKAALEIVRTAVKDLEIDVASDFVIQIAVKSVDGQGKIESISYSGTAAPVRSAGKAGKGGSTDLPPEGTVCVRTIKGVERTLRVLRGGHLLLDDQELVNSATDAAKKALASNTPINGRAFWFQQGRQRMEPVRDVPANLLQP